MLLLALLLVSQAALASITVLPAALPYGVSRHSCVSSGDSVYCFGGGGLKSGYKDQIVRYDPTTNAVTTISAKLPSGRADLSCAAIGSSIYCFGGEAKANNGADIDEIVRYDVTANMVSTMSAKLPSKTDSLSCVASKGNIYCFGGWSGLSSIIRYNVASDTVTKMSARLPSGTYDLSCSPLGDDIYCFGGQGYMFLYKDWILKYEVQSDKLVVSSAAMPSKVAYLSCASLDDSIYCFGGYGSGRQDQTIRYNATSDAVAMMSDKLPNEPNKHSCTSLDGNIYCFGGDGSYRVPDYGWDSGDLSKIVRYNPENDTATLYVPPPTPSVSATPTPTPTPSPTPTPILPVMRVWVNGEQLILDDVDYYGIRHARNMPANREIKLKIGEPVDIKVEVTSKGDGKIKTMLGDRGMWLDYDTPTYKSSFDVLSGSTDGLGKALVNENVTDGWSKEYMWRIAPNGYRGKYNESIAGLYAYAWSGESIDNKTGAGRDPTAEVVHIATIRFADEQYGGDSVTGKQASNPTLAAISNDTMNSTTTGQISDKQAKAVAPSAASSDNSIFIGAIIALAVIGGIILFLRRAKPQP